MSSIDSESDSPAFRSVDHLSTQPTGFTGVQSGRVVAITPDGDILVQIDGTNDELTACDFLQASQTDFPVFSVGDEVLVHLSQPGGRGCVLGAKKRYAPSRSEQADEVEQPVPDHILVEAGQSLSLRCGETTIKITKEGKILIKGIDILARAKRTHRIKGGSVAIN